LRRKFKRYATAGDAAEVACIQLKISAIQRKHGAVTGAGRKTMNAQIEQQTQDTEITDVVEEIGGTLQAAFDLLIERRDRQYAAAIEPLDAERDTLELESASIGEARRNLERLLPAKAREAQRAADALMVAGRHDAAQLKLTEAEEAANAPAAMTERQREISTRCEAIDREKGAIARMSFGRPSTGFL
jgi:hypothetical protein